MMMMCNRLIGKGWMLSRSFGYLFTLQLAFDLYLGMVRLIGLVGTVK